MRNGFDFLSTGETANPNVFVGELEYTSYGLTRVVAYVCGKGWLCNRHELKLLIEGEEPLEDWLVPWEDE